MRRPFVLVIVLTAAIGATVALARNGVTVSRRSNTRVLGCNSVITHSDDLILIASGGVWGTSALGANTPPIIRDASYSEGPARGGVTCRSGFSGASVPCGPSLTSTHVHFPLYTQPGSSYLAEVFTFDAGLKRISFWVKAYPDGGYPGHQNAGLLFSDNVTSNYACVPTAAGWANDSDLGIWTFCDGLMSTTNAAALAVLLGPSSGSANPPSPTYFAGDFLFTGVNIRATDAAVTDTTAYTCIN